jgi:murein DD-endopeptidase MepM/ murein hydrolase activator NlpD
LGVVGNSGSSLQPHLHFQVMNTPDPFPLFRNLVPFALSSAQRRNGEKWELLINGKLRNGDHLRL